MKELICIVCPRGCHLTVDEANDYAVTGNFCKRGEVYGKAEVTNPVRVVTSTVSISGSADGEVRGPVKTADAIPKKLIFEAMKSIEAASVKAPVRIGDVVIPHICGTGIDLVACKNIA